MTRRPLLWQKDFEGCERLGGLLGGLSVFTDSIEIGGCSTSSSNDWDKGIKNIQQNKLYKRVAVVFI
jgi:hypothetical protein